MEELAEIFFSVEGRLPRRGYWMCLIVTLVVSLVYFLIIAIVAGAATVNLPIYGAFSFSLGRILVSLPLWIFSWALFLAVATRRLHDRDKSARWLLVYVLAPLVMSNLGAMMVGLAGNPLKAGSAMELGAGAIWLWAFIEFGFLRGTRGANQYGPDPLGVYDEQAAAAFE